MINFNTNMDLLIKIIFIFVLSIKSCENLQVSNETQFGPIEGIFGKVTKTVIYGGATFARFNNRLLCPLLKRETDKDNQDQPILYVFNNFLEKQRAFRIYSDDEITPWMIEVAQFDPEQITYIFVHGWLGGIHNELWLNEAKNTILKESETFYKYQKQHLKKKDKQNKIYPSKFDNFKTKYKFRNKNYFYKFNDSTIINKHNYFKYEQDENNNINNNKLDYDGEEKEEEGEEIKVEESNFRPNVIIVEWSDFAHGNLYTATQNSFKVSKRLGDLLIQLAEVGNIKPELIHCLGHSIGAHICGQAARYAFPAKKISPLYKRKLSYSLLNGNFNQLIHKRLGRITALDPGGFCYELGIFNETTYLGLKPSDALVVDAYYSNRSPFGNKYLVGQYNVRINNGYFQKPCSVWLNSSTAIDYFKAAIRFTMGSIGNNDILTCDHYFATRFAALIPSNKFNNNNNNNNNNGEHQFQQCSYMAYGCDSYRNFLRGRCGLCETIQQCYPMDFEYQRQFNSSLSQVKNSLKHLGKYSSYFNDLNYNNKDYDFDNYDLEDSDPSLPLGGVKYSNRKIYYMLITNEEPYCSAIYRIRVNLNHNVVDINSFRNRWLELRVYTNNGELLSVKDAFSGKVGETIPLYGPWLMNPEERIFSGVEANTLTGMFSLINLNERVREFGGSYLEKIKSLVVTYNNRLSSRQDPLANPIETIQIDYLSSSNEEIRAKNSHTFTADNFVIVYKHLEQTAELAEIQDS